MQYLVLFGSCITSKTKVLAAAQPGTLAGDIKAHRASLGNGDGDGYRKQGYKCPLKRFNRQRREAREYC
jgi:hypothetical protein